MFLLLKNPEIKIKENRLVWVIAPSETLPPPTVETTDTAKNLVRTFNPPNRKMESNHHEIEQNDPKKIRAERLADALATNSKYLSEIELKTLAAEEIGREKMCEDFLDLRTEKLSEGQIIDVNFCENNDAEWEIGAGDLLPANVREITVKTKDGKILQGKRAPSEEYPNPPRVGYYEKSNDPSSYVPIHSNDQEMVIGKIFGEEEMATLNEKLKKVLDRKNINEAENSIHETRLQESEEREKKMNELQEKYGVQETGNLEKDFINLSKAIARDIEKKFGIPWKVTLAQTALETGMGKHAPQNNFFGIKGSGKKLKTKEFINGKEISVVDSFANYKSPIESFLAYAKLLTTSPRYRSIVEAHKKNPITPKEFLQKIIEAGYATDPFYVSKAENLMNHYGISMEA
ncbi:glucosaminidase domain-containing protein [Candidatus Gracilibacteria bacterium]|nr:glucosaminidase domain-containing protein [Candidatus Gracilibacteria bacterium]